MARSIRDLKVNESGIISGFASEANILKLMEMGCLPGSEVLLKFVAPFKGPLYISVGGNQIAIRRGIAKNILLVDNN